MALGKILQLLETIKRMIAKDRIVAHRGAWKYFDLPQNSLAAIQKAQELGVGGVELDIHLTKDNQLVVFHDNILNGQSIHELTYDEIGVNLLSNGEKIPLLNDVLSIWNQQINLWIELKSADLSLHRRLVLIDKLIHVMNEYRDKVFVISFELATLRMLKEANPLIKVAYLGNEFSIEFLSQKKIDGVDLHFETHLTSPEFISQLKIKKMISNAWTVNDVDMIQTLLNNGIDYITTDEINLELL